MKPPFFPLFLPVLALFFPVGAGSVAAQEPVAPAETTLSAPFPKEEVCDRFNKLNTGIRDGKVTRGAAVPELARLLVEVAEEYYRRGGKKFAPETWRFPVAGYDSRAVGGGKGRGYLAGGYDFFQGNRHGGHPSYDIFIRDRDQNGLDDRKRGPVPVLSMTGGIVVAIEREWQPGSLLRGGKYVWVYDPATDLLVYYAHNRDLVVELGELVEPGSLLGFVGRSGYNAYRRRSPTHLHLTVLKGNRGRPVPVRIYPLLARAGTFSPGAEGEASFEEAR